MGNPNTAESTTQAAQPFSTSDMGFLVLLFLAFVVSGRLDLSLLRMQHGGGVVWIPAGVSLAAVLIRGRRMLPAVFLGSLFVALMATGHWVGSLGVALGSTTEVLLAAHLTKRFAEGIDAFSRPSYVLRFVLFAGILAPIAGAFAGAPAICLAFNKGTAGVWPMILSWSAGHAVGMIALTPFLALLLSGRHKALQAPEIIETSLMLLGICIACILTFGPPVFPSLHGNFPFFFAVPFLVWAAVRFCPLEASGACVLLSGFATWGSAHGYGPFAGDSQSAFSLLACLFVAATMTLIGASTVARQRRVSEELLETLYRLQHEKDREIAESKAENDFLRDELIRRAHARMHRELPPESGEGDPNSVEVMWYLDAETENIIYVSPSYETVWGRSRKELQGDKHRWFDSVLPEDRELAIQFVGQEFPNDRVETSYRIRRPDGSIRWIFDRGFVVRDTFGKPIRLIGLATDITELVVQGQVLSAHLERQGSGPLRDSSADTQLRRKQG